MQYVKSYSNTGSIIHVKIKVNSCLLKVTDSLGLYPVCLHSFVAYEQ
jgi:hypothetical protein